MRRREFVAAALSTAGAGVTAVAAPGRYSISESRTETEPRQRLLVLRDETGGLEAAIAPEQGGELSGLRFRFRKQWLELLYRARDYSPVSGWRGKAPLLWPATGRNFRPGLKPDGGAEVVGGYEWNGRAYPLPIHGFVRQAPWVVERQAADERAVSAVLTIGDSPESRRYYPFAFKLSVEYRIAGGELLMIYTVRAGEANSEPMFFSIGNHITFRTPFAEGSDPRGMLFESPSEVEYLKSAQGLPTGERRPRSYREPVRMSELDTRSAVSLGGYRETPFVRLTDPAGISLRMSHEADSLPEPPVVQFNLWGDAGEGYFSPEPWVGLQNSFVLRQGLVILKPGGAWRWRVSIWPSAR